MSLKSDIYCLEMSFTKLAGVQPGEPATGSSGG